MSNLTQHLTLWVALLLSVCSFDAIAQFTDCDPDAPKIRYRSRNFFTGSPIVTTNVPYGSDAVQLMDVYLPPASDVATDRPLAVWAHPGGFVIGDKGTEGAVLWCTEMAKMGYVAISIGYTKDMVGEISGGTINGAGPAGGAVRAVYRAMQDARSAIRYMRSEATTFGIDPSKVVMAGSSAGAVMTVNLAYMEDAERPGVTKGVFILRSDFGCPDCGDGAFEDNSTWDGDILAGQMSWGGLEDFDDGDGILDVIDDFNDNDGDGQIDTERMLFMHGDDDDVVPATAGKPFQNFGALAGLVVPDLYGTYPIRQRLASLGSNAPQWEAYVLCAEQHEFELDEQDGGNGDFGPDGVPDQNFDYWFQETVDHFYHAMNPTLPETGALETIVDNGAGNTLNACDNSSVGTYAPNAYSTYRVSSPNAGSEYCWDLTKGSILTGQGTPEITVRWDNTPNAQNTPNDAVGRTGTVLCFEKTMSGSTELVYKASHHLLLINDGPSTSPNANYTHTTGTGIRQIYFVDASTNADHPTENYTWDFGDGTVVAGTNATPTHTYAADGSYTVKLTVTNQFGNRSDYEEVVNVVTTGIPGIQVSPRVFLQGAFNTTDMNSSLEAGGQLPTNEPYTALGFTGLQNAGAPLAASYVVGTGSDVVVDWVLVELRDGSDETNIVSKRAALLQKDGDV
ncbi:MAG: PKD domain-containing protein, partial [Bacteroidota bacterium]